jgi:hypothetical protein
MSTPATSGTTRATGERRVAKAWYIDRMVLLFEDMKARRPQYAAWEYGPETGPARRPTPERP